MRESRGSGKAAGGLAKIRQNWNCQSHFRGQLPIMENFEFFLDLFDKSVSDDWVIHRGLS